MSAPGPISPREHGDTLAARVRPASTAVAAAALAAALAAHPVATGAAASSPQSAVAVASDAARESALARENAAGPLLDREQLRRCIYEQLRLSAETDSIVEASHALDAERASIARLGAELKSRAETLDRADRGAVDAYNAQAEARNASIVRHKAAVAKVEERMRAIEPARLAWSRDCANRPFRQEDRDAINSGH